MDTARFTNSDFFGPLQGLMRWWSASRTPVAGLPLPKRKVHNFTPKSIAENGVFTGAKHQNCIMPKPLRVLRVVESGQGCSSVGRMVISGRMADVCAELDRLAAREASLS
jgi:hypothetical protein